MKADECGAVRSLMDLHSDHLMQKHSCFVFQAVCVYVYQ